jgi:hypothetical protein
VLAVEAARSVRGLWAPGVVGSDRCSADCACLALKQCWIPLDRAELNLEISDKRALGVVLAVAALVYMQIIIQIFTTNIAATWSNDQYLYINSPQSVTSANAVSLLCVRISQYVGFAAAATLAMASRSRIRLGVLLLLPATIYLFLVGFGAHSRSAALILFCAAAVLISSEARSDRAISWSLIGLGAFCWISALSGRAIGHHGISSIGETIVATLGNLSTPDHLFSYILNPLEGIFSVATGSLMKMDYTLGYKILSFSPTPSFIDHFDKIYLNQQIRINAYTPMPGILEAFAFGPIYFGFLLLVVFVVCRTVTQLSIKVAGALPTLVNFVVSLSVIYLFAYNLRNGFRAILACGAVSLAIFGFKLGRSVLRREPVKARLMPRPLSVV